MESQSADSVVTGLGVGTSIGGAAISIAGFFAAYNPIFIGLASMLSITVALVTLYYKLKRERIYNQTHKKKP